MLMTIDGEDVKRMMDEEARQMARDRYYVVKGMWIEPNAKVVTTSDGKVWVMAAVCVSEDT